MLLTGGKISRMRMKVQVRLMQARFIKIHQVFAKKKSDTFLTDLVWYLCMYMYYVLSVGNRNIFEKYGIYVCICIMFSV